MSEQLLSDPAAERAVLSGIYQLGSEAYLDVADMLQVESFSDPSNQILFKCMKHLYDKNPDIEMDQPTLLATAGELGFSKMLTGRKELGYLRAIGNMPIKLTNVRSFAADIRKIQIRNQLMRIGDEIKQDVANAPKESTISQLLAVAENPLFDFQNLLNNDTDQTIQKIGSGVLDLIQYLKDNPVQQVGISTGYKYLDNAIGGGLRRKTVNLIGARAKIGKTQLVDNIGLHISSVLGLPVLNLDTEMDKEQHQFRIMANIAGVEIDEIETGQFGKNPQHVEALLKAGELLEKIPYDYICINGMPFEEVLANVRRWIVKVVGKDENGKTKPCVVLYDYLKLMSQDGITGANALQEFQMLGFMMGALHNFTVRYDIPVLSFIQLNRDGITKETTDAASGSDRLIWLCSNFSIFKEKSDEEIKEDGEENGNRKLVPVIARHGKGLPSGDYINMLFEGQFGRITELNLRSEIVKKKKRDNEGFEVDADDDYVKKSLEDETDPFAD